MVREREWAGGGEGGREGGRERERERERGPKENIYQCCFPLNFFSLFRTQNGIGTMCSNLTVNKTNQLHNFNFKILFYVLQIKHRGVCHSVTDSNIKSHPVYIMYISVVYGSAHNKMGIVVSNITVAPQKKPTNKQKPQTQQNTKGVKNHLKLNSLDLHDSPPPPHHQIKNTQ